MKADAASGGRNAGLIQRTMQLRLIPLQDQQGAGIVSGNLDLRCAGCRSSNSYLNHAEIARLQANRHLLAAISSFRQCQKGRCDLLGRCRRVRLRWSGYGSHGCHYGRRDDRRHLLQRCDGRRRGLRWIGRYIDRTKRDFVVRGGGRGRNRQAGDIRRCARKALVCRRDGILIGGLRPVSRVGLRTCARSSGRWY